jgi:hypothetical protein
LAAARSWPLNSKLSRNPNVSVFKVRRNRGSIFVHTLTLVSHSLLHRHTSSSMSKDSRCKVQFYGTWVRCSHHNCFSCVTALGPEILILHYPLLLTWPFHSTDDVFNLPVNWEMHISKFMWWKKSPSFKNNCRCTRLCPLSPLQCFSFYLPSSSEITVWCAPSAVLRRKSSHGPDMQSLAFHLNRASFAFGCWRPTTAWLSQPSQSIYTPLHSLHLESLSNTHLTVGHLQLLPPIIMPRYTSSLHRYHQEYVFWDGWSFSANIVPAAKNVYTTRHSSVYMELRKLHKQDGFPNTVSVSQNCRRIQSESEI